MFASTAESAMVPAQKLSCSVSHLHRVIGEDLSYRKPGRPS